MKKLAVLITVLILGGTLLVSAHRKPKRVWKIDCITITADKKGVVVEGVDGKVFDDPQLTDDFRNAFQSACSHWIKESIGVEN